MRTNFALLAAAAASVMAIAPASAAVSVIQLQQSYVFTSPYDLHHALSYNTYADGGGGTTNSYNVPAPGGVMVDGFPKSSANPPVLTYFLGTSNLFDEVTTDSGLDGHLLIAFNDAFAAALLGTPQDFTTTFSGFNESDLIAALTLLDTADLDPLDAGYAAQMAAKNDASSLLFGFSDTVNGMGGLTAANGGTFTLLSFSTPAPAGAGVALLTPIPGAVPEPGTWLMMIGGFGAIGFALRRRPKVSITYA